jgi:hypothetical protein
MPEFTSSDQRAPGFVIGARAARTTTGQPATGAATQFRDAEPHSPCTRAAARRHAAPAIRGCRVDDTSLLDLLFPRGIPIAGRLTRPMSPRRCLRPVERDLHRSRTAHYVSIAAIAITGTIWWYRERSRRNRASNRIDRDLRASDAAIAGQPGGSHPRPHAASCWARTRPRCGALPGAPFSSAAATVAAGQLRAARSTGTHSACDRRDAIRARCRRHSRRMLEERFGAAG